MVRNGFRTRIIEVRIRVLFVVLCYYKVDFKSNSTLQNLIVR